MAIKPENTPSDRRSALERSTGIGASRLPDARREPEPDENALLDDIPIDPARVPSDQETTTRSVEIVSSRLVATPTSPAFSSAAGQNRPAAAAGRPEPTELLTAGRLLESDRSRSQTPEGGWSRLVYRATFGAVNLGDSATVRARKELDARIQRPLAGGARFVPILTRKGGVGKTTVTTLLGMALASFREDRIVAVDANPDRGTLSDRFTDSPAATILDVVRRSTELTDFTDFSALITRDATRLDVLASDTDATHREGLTEHDYSAVADVVSRFYSIVLTDCGTGIVDSVMTGVLERADTAVIVSGGSVDEARLASETLSWLEANGYADVARNSIVAFNTATQGTNLVKVTEIEAHFRSRVRDIVRIPYDPALATGSRVLWNDLQPLTRYCARVLAAMVVANLEVPRTADVSSVR